MASEVPPDARLCAQCKTDISALSARNLYCSKSCSGKAHYQKNAAKYKARAKRWANANPEKMKAAIMNWHAANSEKHRESARRQSAKRSALRVQEMPDRLCIGCGSAIPKEKYRTAKYCSPACACRHRALMAARADPEANRAKVRAWQRANPGRVREQARKRWLENREQELQRSRRWAAANKEKRRASCLAWARKNPDKVREIGLRSRLKNPRKQPRDYKVAWTAARRAKKRKATPEWLTRAQHTKMRALYAEAARLTAETGIKQHVDHIVPLKGRTVSGLHVPWNLQILPASLNQKKSNRLDPVWLQEAA